MKVHEFIPVMEAPGEVPPGISFIENQPDDSMAIKGNRAIAVFLKDHPECEWLIFRHADTSNIDTLDVIEDKLMAMQDDVAVVGVIGTLALDPSCAWWQSHRSVNGVGAILQGNGDQPPYPMNDWPVSRFPNAVSVDGCWLALRRSALEAGLRFCELIPGWHFYDVLICMQALSMGWRVGVTDIHIRHDSRGEMPREWYRNQTVVRKLISDAIGGQWPIVSGLTDFNRRVY